MLLRFPRSSHRNGLAIFHAADCFYTHSLALLTPHYYSAYTLYLTPLVTVTTTLVASCAPSATSGAAGK